MRTFNLPGPQALLQARFQKSLQAKLQARSQANSQARLQEVLLTTREQRYSALLAVLATVAETAGCVITMSLNIPGSNKMPPGASRLMEFTLQALRNALPAASVVANTVDALGPFALIVHYFGNTANTANTANTGQQENAHCIKQVCVDLETRNPAARLIDLDVFQSPCRQIGRAELGLPPRGCLVCDQPAVDCMRLKRHASSLIVSQVNLILNYNFLNLY